MSGGKMNGKKLPRDFFQGPTLEVARRLLGKTLVHMSCSGRTAGKIVETEAYIGPGDPASLAHDGRSTVTEVMFGEAGHAFVCSDGEDGCCLHVVTERTGFPASVLIRSAEPLEGLELMRKNLALDCCDLELANTPTRLCRAMGIELDRNRQDLCGALIFVEDGGAECGEIVATKRVGVEHAGAWADMPWRLYVQGSPCVLVTE
jgi:DNA-3-methyladenine glycosylase